MDGVSQFFAAISDDAPIVRVTIIEALGSTPREAGAYILVAAGQSEDAPVLAGTIGGGALELEAIAHAREILSEEAGPWLRRVRDYPLGPRLGQCCGGFAKLLFEHITAQGRSFFFFEKNAPAFLVRDIDGQSPPIALNSAEDGVHLTGANLTGANLKGGTIKTGDKIEDGALPDGLAQALFSKASPIPKDLSQDLSKDLPSLSQDDPHQDLSMPAQALGPSVRPGGDGGFERPRLWRDEAGGKTYFIEPGPARPLPIFLYGAGHVGREIVRMAANLPVAISWVDTDAARFPQDLPENVTRLIAAAPAMAARYAPADGFHVVMTYSHAMDFEICHAVLARAEFRYLGLIGSMTKKARFLKRLRALGIGDDLLARMICPIGVGGLKGKEPGVIALSLLAEIFSRRTQMREGAKGVGSQDIKGVLCDA